MEIKQEVKAGGSPVWLLERSTSTGVSNLKAAFHQRPWLEIGLLLLIVAVAAGLRFYRLGDWSLWEDEAFTLSAREDGFNYSIWRRSLAVTLIQLVTSQLGNDAWSGRLVPALIGVLTVAVLYFPIRRRYGPGVALLAGGLLAVNTWHLYWSQNIRFYSLLLLFYSLGLLLFDLGLEENRPWALLGSLAFFALAARESLVALFFAPVAVAYLSLLYLMPWEKPPGLNWRNLLIFFGPGLIGGLVFAGPYLNNLSGWFEGFKRINTEPFWIFAGVVYYVGLPAVVIAAFGALYLLANRQRAALLLSLGAGLPLLATMFLSLIQYSANRYAFITLVPWILLAALAALHLWEHTNGSARILALGVLALLLAAPMSENVLYFRYQNGNRADWAAALDYIKRNKQPGDLVYTTSTEVSDYYLEERTHFFSVWEPGYSPPGGSVWFVEDLTTAERFPKKLAWIHQNARQMAVFDVHALARNFKMRVYRYPPSGW